MIMLQCRVIEDALRKVVHAFPLFVVFHALSLLFLLFKHLYVEWVVSWYDVIVQSWSYILIYVGCSLFIIWSHFIWVFVQVSDFKIGSFIWYKWDVHELWFITFPLFTVVIFWSLDTYDLWLVQKLLLRIFEVWLFVIKWVKAYEIAFIIIFWIYLNSYWRINIF